VHHSDAGGVLRELERWLSISARPFVRNRENAITGGLQIVAHAVPSERFSSTESVATEHFPSSSASWLGESFLDT
jgi:hypothetical protein